MEGHAAVRDAACVVVETVLLASAAEGDPDADKVANRILNKLFGDFPYVDPDILRMSCAAALYAMRATARKRYPNCMRSDRLARQATMDSPQVVSTSAHPTALVDGVYAMADGIVAAVAGGGQAFGDATTLREIARGIVATGVRVMATLMVEFAHTKVVTLVPGLPTSGDPLVRLNGSDGRMTHAEENALMVAVQPNADPANVAFIAARTVGHIEVVTMKEVFHGQADHLKALNTAMVCKRGLRSVVHLERGLHTLGFIPNQDVPGYTFKQVYQGSVWPDSGDGVNLEPCKKGREEKKNVYMSIRQLCEQGALDTLAALGPDLHLEAILQRWERDPDLTAAAAAGSPGHLVYALHEDMYAAAARADPPVSADDVLVALALLGDLAALWLIDPFLVACQPEERGLATPEITAAVQDDSFGYGGNSLHLQTLNLTGNRVQNLDYAVVRIGFTPADAGGERGFLAVAGAVKVKTKGKERVRMFSADDTASLYNGVIPNAADYAQYLNYFMMAKGRYDIQVSSDWEFIRSTKRIGIESLRRFVTVGLVFVRAYDVRLADYPDLARARMVPIVTASRMLGVVVSSGGVDEALAWVGSSLKELGAASLLCADFFADTCGYRGPLLVESIYKAPLAILNRMVDAKGAWRQGAKARFEATRHVLAAALKANGTVTLTLAASHDLVDYGADYLLSNAGGGGGGAARKLLHESDVQPYAVIEAAKACALGLSQREETLDTGEVLAEAVGLVVPDVVLPTVDYTEAPIPMASGLSGHRTKLEAPNQPFSGAIPGHLLAYPPGRDAFPAERAGKWGAPLTDGVDDLSKLPVFTAAVVPRRPPVSVLDKKRVGIDRVDLPRRPAAAPDAPAGPPADAAPASPSAAVAPPAATVAVAPPPATLAVAPPAAAMEVDAAPAAMEVDAAPAAMEVDAAPAAMEATATPAARGAAAAATAPMPAATSATGAAGTQGVSNKRVASSATAPTRPPPSARARTAALAAALAAAPPSPPPASPPASSPPPAGEIVPAVAAPASPVADPAPQPAGQPAGKAQALPPAPSRRPPQPLQDLNVKDGEVKLNKMFFQRK